ncbi:tRNA(Met) cytidine acetyltransferase TmcA [Rosenbergiella australiborealis]|uniref:tRNA(Met) cytidine acetyltransferase TmcA n=1 Tax=Rosenbergiella australiborealis TaxID=1544696 RepID=UPI001F4ED035
MQPAFIVEQMRRSGVRRICVISGSAVFRAKATAEWQADYPGDWRRISTVATGHPKEIVAQAARQFLGQEGLHAIYDASRGMHLEVFAALAGTLVAGSWLLLLLPSDTDKEVVVDEDSQRWADCEQPITTPVFNRHLWRQLTQSADHLIWREGSIKPDQRLLNTRVWQPQGNTQQQAIIDELVSATAGNFIVTAPRGRGKSALGGMLAARQAPCLITGPAKLSTAVMAEFAKEHYHFMAPDAILAENTTTSWRWLIIDEAASLPSAQLQALVSRFPRCLLLTTTEGYEGTGQGFLLKFSASIAVNHHYRLHNPHRYQADDPLETFVERLLVLHNPQPLPSLLPQKKRLTLRAYHPSDWDFHVQLAASTFHLLQSAHYRTTPLDLRRMMDAPQSGYWQLVADEQCYGVVGWIDEGGQSAELSQAVWRGERRPRGNLIAQSLAAHSRFPQAMQLASRRISRIAINQSLRREGCGRRLVEAVFSQSQDKDFISVSFGFTPELWQFWQHCGFQLVRIGGMREASSGCYAAMAIFPISAAGQQLCTQAVAHFQRDWPIQQSRFCPEIELPITARLDHPFSVADHHELVGFAHAHRPLSVSFPSLVRALHAYPQLARWSHLHHCLVSTQRPEGWSHKQWLAQLRRETAEFLMILSEVSANETEGLL